MSASQAGGMPGRGQNQQNIQRAMLKLNTLMFQGMMKFGSAGLEGITAGQAGDQQGAQTAAQKMMMAKTEMQQVKAAVSAMQPAGEAPLAGGQTGVAQPVSGQNDALTGRPISGHPQQQTI